MALEDGVCPACTETRLDGINQGKNAGRSCWAVPNTNCGNAAADKLTLCLECTFFKQVQYEEGRNFVMMGEILKCLKNKK